MVIDYSIDPRGFNPLDSVVDGVARSVGSIILEGVIIEEGI
jgi:hypothetical protein